ncbi:MAG: alpha/beta hydrolase [Promethearchaeota archaeon]
MDVQRIKKTLLWEKKNATIGALLVAAVLCTLPTTAKIVKTQFLPDQYNITATRTISFTSHADPHGPFTVAGNLWIPDNHTFPGPRPAVVACHGFTGGPGKEFMNRYALELAKRGFVVLSLDLPGYGATTNRFSTFFPRADFEPLVLLDAIGYLGSLRDLVNSSAIGLIGHSYGGATVALAAGVLGSMVNATVCLNGFTNLTALLSEVFLPRISDGVEVTPDVVETGLSPGELDSLLRLFRLYRGDEGDLGNLVVPGTTALNRTVLRKYDAVEYLWNATPGGVMFVQGTLDDSFGDTNQSGLGVNASSSGAVFIPVEDDHVLTRDPEKTADYCYLNFFEEKLLGVDLGNGSTSLGRYSQHRNITLTYERGTGTGVLWEVFGVQVALFLIAVAVFDVVLYDKANYTNRPPVGTCRDLGKRRTRDYLKSVVLVSGVVFFSFVAMSWLSLGVLPYSTLGTVLFLGFFLTFLFFYVFPSDPRLEARPAGGVDDTTDADANGSPTSTRTVLLGLGAAAGAGLVGLSASALPPVFHRPAEPILWALLCAGLVLVTTGVGLIASRVRENPGTDWGDFNLDPYEVLRGGLFGVALASVVVLQWNAMAMYLDFPYANAPRGAYFLFGAVAVLAFSWGLEVWAGGVLKRELPGARSTAVGAAAVFLATTLAFAGILSGGILDHAYLLASLIVTALYLATRGIRALFYDKHFSIGATFFPLFALWGLSVFFHM